jgi:biopolymer transport protein ExbD
VQFRRPVQTSTSINIAPIVDVVFLLVIFFAVSTTFLEDAGLKLELPSSTSTAARESEPLTVLLGADGTLFFEGRETDHARLRERLQQTLEGREVRRVVLKADGGARHADVVRVMDVIRDSGADALTVAARPAPGE